MLAWNVQWKGYLPGLVGAVMVPLPPPPGTVTSKSPPWSEVTVCERLSESVMVIFAPGFTLTGTPYLKSLMVISALAAGWAAADDPLADGFDGTEEVDGTEGVEPGALVVDEAACEGVDAP